MSLSEKYIWVTRISAEEIETRDSVIHKHLEMVKRILEQYKTYLQIIDGQTVKEEGNSFVAVFTNAVQCVFAAQSVRDAISKTSNGVMQWTALDVYLVEPKDPTGTSEASKLYSGNHIEQRARQLLDLCPEGYTICSDGLLGGIKQSARKTFELHGPFFGKLKTSVRPIRFWAIDQLPSFRPTSWQTDRPINIQGTLSQLSNQGISEMLANITSAPVWLLTRNLGFYRIGTFLFFVLYAVSKVIRWQRLELHSCIGLGDVIMLRKRHERAVPWTIHASQVAHHLGDDFYQAQTSYQVGHCMAHIEAKPEAVRYLHSAFESFERLADARMAGWSALYLGRCLRGMGNLEEAEDWILASLVIFSSAGHLRRQLAYGITQLARLRALQDQFGDYRWCIQQARKLYPKVAGRAADDAFWEPKLRSIEENASRISDNNHATIIDPARELVMAALASLSKP